MMYRVSHQYVNALEAVSSSEAIYCVKRSYDI